MKGRNKKILIPVLVLGILAVIVLIFTVLIIHGRSNAYSKFAFEDGEVFCLGDNAGGKGKSITIGEYLIYAASIAQTSTKEYGTDVWTKTVQDDNGKDITFEEYTKQEIINQIRTTYILNQKAEEYGQALTEDELRNISADAQSYYDTLSAYNIGSAGIDLPLILNIYTENALAEKVYNKITTEAEAADGMTEDEYNAARIHYFDSVYQKLKEESCKKWSYDIYVNKKVLDELSFADLYTKAADNTGEAGSNR